MKKNLIYWVRLVAVVAMVFMIAGQANAKCDVDNGEKLEIKCDDDHDFIYIFAEGQVEDDGSRTLLGYFMEVGEPDPPIKLDDNLKDIVIELGGGGARVGIWGDYDPSYGLYVSGSIEVKSGEGHDCVEVGGIVTVGNDLKIVTGKGDDRVNVSGNVTVGNDLKIETNEGADALQIGYDLDVKNTVDIKTGSGDDIVQVFDGDEDEVGVTAGNDIKIDGESGKDALCEGHCVGLEEKPDLDVCDEDYLDAGNKVEIKNFENIIAGQTCDSDSDSD